MLDAIAIPREAKSKSLNTYANKTQPMIKKRINISGSTIIACITKMLKPKGWFTKPGKIENIHVECSNCGRHINLDQLVLIVDYEEDTDQKY